MPFPSPPVRRPPLPPPAHCLRHNNRTIVIASHILSVCSEAWMTPKSAIWDTISAGGICVHEQAGSCRLPSTPDVGSHVQADAYPRFRGCGAFKTWGVHIQTLLKHFSELGHDAGLRAPPPLNPRSGSVSCLARSPLSSLSDLYT